MNAADSFFIGLVEKVEETNGYLKCLEEMITCVKLEWQPNRY